MTNQWPASWWTEERVAELRQRWEKWETFSEIAVALGHWSRNAIIGKAHRLGLRRPSIKPHQPTPKPRLRRRSNGHAKGDIVSAETPPIFANPKPFIELNADDCRWPDFNAQPGPDLPCCAAPAVPGRPYCLAHCRISYASTPRPKR